MSKKQDDILFLFFKGHFLLHIMNKLRIVGSQLYGQLIDEPLMTQKVFHVCDDGGNRLPELSQLKLSHICVLVKPQYPCQLLNEVDLFNIAQFHHIHVFLIR